MQNRWQTHISLSDIHSCNASCERPAKYIQLCISPERSVEGVPVHSAWAHMSISLWSCLHGAGVLSVRECDPNGIILPSKGSIHELEMTLIGEAPETERHSSSNFTPVHWTAFESDRCSEERLRERMRWTERGLEEVKKEICV